MFCRGDVVRYPARTLGYFFDAIVESRCGPDHVYVRLLRHGSHLPTGGVWGRSRLVHVRSLKAAKHNHLGHPVATDVEDLRADGKRQPWAGELYELLGIDAP